MQPKDVPSVLKDLPEDIAMIIIRVLELEHGKLYLERPHVVEDVVRIIKEEVQ